MHGEENYVRGDYSKSASTNLNMVSNAISHGANMPISKYLELGNHVQNRYFNRNIKELVKKRHSGGNDPIRKSERKVRNLVSGESREGIIQCIYNDFIDFANANPKTKEWLQKFSQ